jgi:bacterioferritin
VAYEFYTELVCVLRYRRHYFMAKGIQSKGVSDQLDLAHVRKKMLLLC